MTKLRVLAIAGLTALGIYPFFRDFIVDFSQILILWLKQRKLTMKPKPKELPKTEALYVAIGSSFAAGPLVGDTIADGYGAGQGSLSYPCILAQKLGLDQHNPKDFVNAASSGALLRKISQSQLQYLGERTRLVTLTAGGNDVDYSRDTVLNGSLSRLKSAKVRSMLERKFQPLRPVEERPFEELSAHFDALIQEIRERAPNATIVVVTYITIMPPKDPLPPLSGYQTALLRLVSERLHQVTVDSALRTRVHLVDMARISVSHHAESEEPWANGFEPTVGAPVHPNEAGHAATASYIYDTLTELKAAPLKE